MVKRKLFVGPMPMPALPPVTPMYQYKPGPQFKTSLNNLQKLDNAISQIAPNYKQDAVNGALSYLGNGGPKSKQNNNNNNKPTPAPTSAPSKGDPIVVFRDSKKNNSYALSPAPNPKPIALNSGIRPNAFSNDSMDPIENACSPLHMHVARLYIPTGSTNPLASYFKNTICFDIQTRAQYNAGFGLDVSSKLSSSQITDAYNAAIYGLQVYFFYSSILSYESNPKNKNAGMIALRQLVTTTIISDVQQLGRRLSDTPIPPRLVEYIRYMNGTFLSSDTQGAPLLKIAPNYSSTGMTTSGTNIASAALSGLVSDSNNTVFSLLRKTIPQWRVGTLYDCPNVPTYDKHFITLFNNASSIAKPGTTSLYSGTVADLKTSVPYNTYHNKLDGVAFAMSNVYIAANADWYPGILVPIASQSVSLDTKISFYNVGGVKAFYAASSIPFITKSRQDTTSYDVATTSNITPHLFGSDRCIAVTGEGLIQSGQDTLDFLFNVDKIPLKGMVSNFNRQA